jgi:hypothetical protein
VKLTLSRLMGGIGAVYGSPNCHKYGGNSGGEGKVPSFFWESIKFVPRIICLMILLTLS